MNILEVHSVEKSFVNPNKEIIPILKGIDMQIQKGESVAITGYSGSGKSTFLSLITGLDTADKGSITIDGTDITKLDEEELSSFRTQKIGIVFQQFYLMNHLSALENVSLPLELSGEKNSKEKAMELLKKVSLAHRYDHLPKQLSGGEMQRVAIARAIAKNPPLLIADEPTGNLDPKTSEQLMDFLFSLIKSQSMTALLVTHNLELAKRCNRIYHLEKGILNEISK